MTTIAAHISLLRFAGPVLDQGAQGACKANQICAAIVLQANEYGQLLAPLSRQQLYNDARELMGTFDRDGGLTIAAAERVATEVGIAAESAFGYGPDTLYRRPDDQVHAQAAQHKVLGFEPLFKMSDPTWFNTYRSPAAIAKLIGEQLMHGKAVLVDAAIHAGFGLDPASSAQPRVGNHSYLIVGADFASGTYAVLNSWGSGWGAGGVGTVKFTDFPGGSADTGFDLLNLSVINGFDGVDLRWTSGREQAAMLYAGLLQRCGEQAGVTYWGDYLGAGGDPRQVAGAMLASREGQALYGGLDNAHFVAAVYQQATGRAADAASVAYFAGSLDSGASRGEVAYCLFHTVDIGADTQSADDRLENLETVSMNYAITYQIDGSHSQAAYAALYEVSDDANTIPAILVGIAQQVYG